MLHGKRKTLFLADLQEKRRQSRVDVYMGALKDFSAKPLYDIDQEDVLNFLIYKDVDNSGRTVVHHTSCPHIGTTSFQHCADKVVCAARHQAASMRTGIISKLRKGFENIGRKGIYNPITLQGDPSSAPLVVQYMNYIRKEQGLSGVVPNQARTFTKHKMDLFMHNMHLDILGRKGIVKLRMKERRALYAFCFSAIKRMVGAGHIIAPNTIRIPCDSGLVFNCTWDKTLRMGVHCFGFLCVKGSEGWCAHCIIDEWVLFARSFFRISFHEGLLFPRLTNKGKVKDGKRWKAKDILDSLARDLKRYNLYEGETAQSFRHGGAVDNFQTGKNLERTMYLACMKNVRTADIYLKGLSFMFPKHDWGKLGVDTSAQVDQVTLACQMRSWRAFMSEGPPL